MNDPVLSREDLKRAIVQNRIKQRILQQQAVQAEAAVRPADRGRALPLSPPQQRLWFIDRLDPAASVAYHMPAALRLEGPLDRAALQRTFDRLMERHEILRTRFACGADGAPHQCIDPPGRFALVEQDLSGLDEAQRQSQLEAAMAEEPRAPFDLAAGPLIRGRLLRLGAQEHVLLITQHHIITDGWSLRRLIDEVTALYAACSTGQADPLAPPILQYADYAAWQQEQAQQQALSEHLDYWREQLSAAPELLDLPTDRPRPRQQDHVGAAVPVELPPRLVEGLKALAQRNGCTVFMTLMAAWSILLARLSGQDEVVIGTPVANRQRSEFETMLGFFADTLAIRMRVPGEWPLSRMLGQAKAALLDAQAHQCVGFERIVDALKPQRNLSYSPLFQAALSFDNTPGSLDVRLPGLRLTQLPMPRDSAHFDLLLALAESGQGIRGEIEYATALFDRATVERWRGHLLVLLEAMVAGDLQPVAALPLLDAGERERIVAGFNPAIAPSAPAALVHPAFQAQAAARPDAVALVQGSRSMSYRELEQRANRLAHYLISQGVAAESRVAICAGRGFDFVVGLLGILKAGGAYVPLDPQYPAERLALMLQDCAPALLLAESASWPALAPALASQPGLPVLMLDAQDTAAMLAAQPERPPDAAACGLHPHSLAYVIYTSGSTGRPKGVMVEHHSVTQLATDNGHVRLGPGDCVAHCSNQAFDAATWEIWGALLNGARLYLVPESVLFDAQALNAALIEGGVTALWLTAGLFHQYRKALQPAFGRLRYLLAGGDVLDPAQVGKVLRPSAAPHRLLNGYGPTETTTFATLHAVSAADCEQRSIPIGRPLSNARIYVLAADGEPVPVGVAGEIHIGGAGVARGYLGRPELTSERFLPDPFGAEPTARMYKTGDLGRWRADGALEYLGRNDFQVKLRGFRIELGEIEAHLLQCPGVADAVVLAREDAPGEKRLAAYVVADPGRELSMAELRGQLGRVLADYMVPSAWVLLAALPLTPNGKLDRKALPAPDRESVPAADYQPPQGEVEERIAAAWRDLLGLDRIGRQDNFFALGGHSLKVVAMVERLRGEGLRLDVRMVFTAPSLQALAAQAAVLADAAATGSDPLPSGPLLPGSLRPSSPRPDRPTADSIPPNLVPPGCTAITPEMLPLATLSQSDIDRIVAATPGGAGNIQDIYRLAPLQEGILFHHLLAGEGEDAYVVRFTMAFDARTDLDAFLAAMQVAIERHDILRTAFHWQGLQQPVQVVWRKASVEVEETAGPLWVGAEHSVSARAVARPERRLDLRQAPLLKVRVAPAAEAGGWHLELFTHHAVLDHVMLDLLMEEVRTIVSGSAAALAPPRPYRDFIAACSQADPSEQEAYFRRRLQDVVEPVMPFGIADTRGSDGAIAEATAPLDAGLARQIRECSRARGATPAVLFHLAWALVVARISGREDVVFGTVLSGRQHGQQGASRALGLFVNTLPLRVRLAPVPVAQALAELQADLAELMLHEQASLALAQRCSGADPALPLFNSIVNYRHNRAPGASGEPMPLWPGARVLSGEERTNYPLTLNLDDDGEGFRLGVQCCASLDPHRIVAYVQAAILGVVAALSGRSQQDVLGIDVLPAEERRLLLEDWNATQAAPGQWLYVHHRFQAQALAHPERIAAQCGRQALSYDELNRRANRWAHRLIECGVGPESRVAICLDRSCEMLVALLAVLKAGGAYVPLDPAYPSQRLAFMLEDSGAQVVLTQAAHRSRLAPAAIAAGATVLALDEAQPSPSTAPHASQDPDAVSTGLAPQRLAYVIYTSGSTGRPKGVMVEHAGLRNYLDWAARCYAPAQGSLVSSSLCFDATITSLLAPLLVGGTVRLLSESGQAEELLAWLQEPAGCGLVKITPAHLDALGKRIQASGAQPRAGVFVVGGEALPASTVRLWRELQPGVRIVNEYGPTETVVGCTIYDVPEALPDAVSTPIGAPLANARIYVLDERGRPAPVGAAGEIHIGGAGVARGYLGRPELTAERFLPDPFLADPSARMYKTGDLGRWRADGMLEYLGRNDFQVKIRGFRIELGEIQAQLEQCPGVRDAAVLAREDVPGDKRLVAYVVAEPGRELSAERVRARLAQTLAEHMLPSAYVWLDRLPLTANGKLDRAALPAPDRASVSAPAYQPPQGEAEERVAAIWRELLGLDQVGRQDNFFALGGHSLLVVRLMGRVAVLAPEMPITALYAAPTLAGFAEALVQWGGPDRDAQPRLAPIARTGALPLSLEQQQVWSRERSDRSAPLQHVVGGVRLRGALDIGALQRSLDALYARHETLRSTVVEADGQPLLRLRDAGEGLPIRHHDLRAHADAESRLQDAAAAEADAPFDLAAGPLVRASLWRTADSEHVLVLAQHPMVSDGWSFSVLLPELQALYAAFLVGHPDPLPPLALQYPDYAAWQRRYLSPERADVHRAYWRERLDGAPALWEGADEDVGDGEQTRPGARVPIRFGAEATRELKRLCAAQGTSVPVALLAAWSWALSHLRGCEDLVIGMTATQRDRPELQALLGCFSTVLPLRLDLSGEPDAVRLLQRTQQALVSAQQHRMLPLHELVHAVRPVSARRAAAPLFQAAFSWQGGGFAGIALPGLETTRWERRYDRVRYELQLALGETDGEIVGALGYSTARFDRPGIECYARALEEAVRAMTAAVAAGRASTFRQTGPATQVGPAAQRQREPIEWMEP